MVEININALENEKQNVIMFYKKQIEAFRNIKRKRKRFSGQIAITMIL